MLYIYTILNTVNYKVYVGQTKNVKNRWSAHKSEAKAGRLQYPLYRALRKYGINNFQISVVEVTKTEEQANLAEQYWIHYFESRSNKGYNLAPGGATPRGWHHTEKHKQHMSDLFRGKRLAPPRSEETKQKMLDILTGHPVSKETRQKISKSNIGKHIITPEIRQKLLNRPKSYGFKGRQHSQESRDKISKASRKFDKETELKITKLYNEGTKVKELMILFSCKEGLIYLIIKRNSLL